MNLRSQGNSFGSPVRPPNTELTLCPVKGSVAVVGDEGKDDMARRADDLVRRITELEEKLVREEGRRPIASPVLERPTDEEVNEHNITHTPPKPWCPYCTKAESLVHASIGSESLVEILGTPRFGGRGSAHDCVTALGNLCGDKIAEVMPHGR